MPYTVYKHTSPNGKIYIGITSQTLIQRFGNGQGYRHCTHFYNAIKKYGWDKFRHETLYENLSKEDAEAKEIELIALYKSNKKEFGYNITCGGSCTQHSEETKHKIREKHIGMKYDEEFGKKQSELKKGNKNRLGQKQSDECKKKISEKNKGKNTGEKNYFHTHIYRGKDHPGSKPVEKYDMNWNLIEKKDCAKVFSDEMGISNASHITDVCRGKRKSAYGFRWKYAKVEEVQ